MKKRLTLIEKARKRLRETEGIYNKVKMVLGWISSLTSWFIYDALLQSGRRMDRMYEGYLSDKNIAKEFVKVYFPESMSHNAKVLDAGCGRGRVVAMLSLLGYDIIGFDREKDAFWHKIDNNRFFVADVQQIPFKDSVFDMCTNFLVLEYIPDDRKAVEEIYRVLKPNSYLVFHVTNKDNLKYKYTGRQLDKKHIREYTIEGITNLLESVGFKIESLKTEGFYSPIFTKLTNNLISRDTWRSWGKLLPERTRGVICIQCRKY